MKATLSGRALDDWINAQDERRMDIGRVTVLARVKPQGRIIRRDGWEPLPPTCLIFNCHMAALEDSDLCAAHVHLRP